jgi:hypothetical protein
MKKGIREGEREVGGDCVCGCSFGEPLKLIVQCLVVLTDRKMSINGRNDYHPHESTFTPLIVPIMQI